MHFRFCRLFLLLLLMPACAPTQPAPRSTNDAERLRANFVATLVAYQQNDRRSLDQLLDNFKLPNSGKFLSGYFASKDVPAVQAKYNGSFDAFCSRLLNNFRRYEGEKTEIAIQPWVKSPGGVTSSPSAPHPSQDLKIESFMIAVGAQGKGRTEWVDSFVLDGGNLRYIGEGSFPFWDAPLSVMVKKTP